jgi:hypothetical protein
MNAWGRKALCAGALWGLTRFALAAPIMVGGQALEIPFPPDTDAALSSSQPNVFRLMQSYVADSQLIEVFAAASNLAHLKEGGLAINCQLQLTQRYANKVVSLAEFARRSDEIERGISTALGGSADFDTQVHEAETAGNRELKRVTGRDTSVKSERPRYHGVFAREPWGFFYSMELPMQVRRGDTTSSALRAVASGFVDAGGKLVSLSCNRRLNEAQDLERTRVQTRAWAQAHLGHRSEGSAAHGARHERTVRKRGLLLPLL